MIKDFFNKGNYNYEENISLKKYNTYRIDILAKYMVFPKNTKELIELINFARTNNIKYMILGNGSNVIFNTTYYDGIIIKLDNFNNMSIKGNKVYAEAGCSLIKLAISTINAELSGLEFACGIPGTVGASISMNAGAYNLDISNSLESISVLTPQNEIITLNKNKLEFSYRDSFLKRNPDYVVLSANFLLKKGNREEMLLQMEERKKRRKDTQPLEYPSAGSVFRNPPSMYAGELIEKCNLKGYCIGDATVSTKHANFIVNKGNATGKDIVSLINKIKEEVKNKYKIELILEQIIVE
ncbi:MAG: UDP-N-acetylmuramate dehydrogenase [Bacilli bacterium]|jgi:UDP-N-acetylmuramate dehydrogenase|nr:UDP-N-acetylmuramate dehydrogenase [Bacilli bacterium]